MDFKRQEASIQSKIEAKEKGFYARLEVKGRLKNEVDPTVFLTFWTVTVGDVRYVLVFPVGPARRDFYKLVDNTELTTVLVTGEAVGINGLMVKTIEFDKD